MSDDNRPGVAIIPGLFGPGDLTGFIGEPRSGKSLLAFHLAASIASGRGTFFGMKLFAGPVLFHTEHSLESMKLRGLAWEKTYEVGLDALFISSGATGPLDDLVAHCITRDFQAGMPPCAIVIDAPFLPDNQRTAVLLDRLLKVCPGHVFFTMTTGAGRGFPVPMSLANLLIGTEIASTKIRVASVVKSPDDLHGPLLTFGIKTVPLGGHVGPVVVEIEAGGKLLI